MWFMEDIAKKENTMSSEERRKLCQQNEVLRKEKETLFMENDRLKLHERVMKKDMDELQKQYISKRDRKFFLEFANEDLKNDYSDLQKELKKTARKLVQASRDLNKEKEGNDYLQRQLTHKDFMHSLETRKLASELMEEKSKTSRIELELEIAERKVQTAEDSSRNVQQALSRKDEEVTKLLKEKKQLFEVLKRHGINLYEGHTGGN